MEGVVLHRKIGDGVPDKAGFMQDRNDTRIMYFCGRKALHLQNFISIFLSKYSDVLMLFHLSGCGFVAVFWLFEHFHNKTRLKKKKAHYHQSLKD